MKEDRGPISPPGPEDSTYLLARRAAMWANDHSTREGGVTMRGIAACQTALDLGARPAAKGQAHE